VQVVHFGKYYPPYRGGIETVLATLCEGLGQRGVNCEVIVASEGGTPGVARHNGVLVRRLRSFGTLCYVPLCPSALTALRCVQADIIHLHHPNPLADLSYFLNRPRGRLVVSYHSDIAVEEGWLSRLSRGHAPLLDLILSRAEVIVAASPQYAATSPVLCRFREKVRIIPYGCHLPDALPATLPQQGRRTGPHYLFIGRLVPYKGVPVLLQAMTQVSGTLWIAGRGPLEGELREQAARARLGDRVEFLGKISEEEKFRRLAACDLLVLPSINRAEAFGMVILEAMAMGRPVVASDLPSGVRMLVQDGVNGVRFPPGDAGALAAVLQRLGGNPGALREMGQRGRQLFLEQYRAPRMVERYHDLYREVCAARAGA